MGPLALASPGCLASKESPVSPRPTRARGPGTPETALCPSPPPAPLSLPGAPGPGGVPWECRGPPAFSVSQLWLLRSLPRSAGLGVCCSWRPRVLASAGVRVAVHLCPPAPGRPWPLGWGLLVLAFPAGASSGRVPEPGSWNVTGSSLHRGECHPPPVPRIPGTQPRPRARATSASAADPARPSPVPRARATGAGGPLPAPVKRAGRSLPTARGSARWPPASPLRDVSRNRTRQGPW